MRVEKGDAVDALANDPLYQLSTSDQDGFHTGMLYWLLSTPLDVAHPLTEISPSFGGSIVERDSRGLDLSVCHDDMGGYELGIINTLHTIPNRKKLEKLRRIRYLTDHLVISLIHPTTKLLEPWRHVPYDELLYPLQISANNLRETGSHEYEADLLDRYVNLIGKLIELRDHHPLSTGPYDAVVLDEAETRRLEDARVLPLVEKIRLSRFAEYLEQRHELKLDVDFSESHGYIQYSAPKISGFLLGWQYQSGCIRLTIELDPIGARLWKARRLQKEEFIEIHFSDFNFTSIPDVDHTLSANSREMKSKPKETNIASTCRSVPPGMTHEQLADACIALASYVSSYSSSN